jgi:nucleoid-associated protein YgaU
MSTLGPRLRGLGATLTLVAFVVGVPAVLLTIDAVPDPAAFAWSQLTAPDDGTLVVEVLAAVCWIAWAVFTCQVVASAVSHVRGIRTPRLPGLAMPQLAADRLIAAAALLFVAVPSATAFLPQSEAAATVATTFQPDPEVAVGRVASPAPAPRTQHETDLETERYTVKRGDSLWRIAEDRLGDGARYTELVALNRAVLDGRPDFLVPGTVLRVPIVEANAPDSYVVQPGDTLSEIAEDELGDAEGYPKIFRASKDTVQPNGAHLTDPDLILPGWTLTIPGQDSHEESPGPKPTKPPDNVSEPMSPPAEAEPFEPFEPSEPSEPSEEPAAESDVLDQAADDSAAPSWLVPGLAGAGAMLGGALWIALRAQRRTQLRHRRPGTVIPPPPAELIPAEKTAHATASVIAPRIDALDAALRSLPSVRLLTVALSTDEVRLALRESAELPSPWSGSGTEWRLNLSVVPNRPDDSFPPYPLLVSVGQGDDGSFLFLNLEELRTVTLTGDSDRNASFARHVAAELAVNPWSIVTTVDVLVLGSDLASFNLGRVRTHPPRDTGFIAELTHNLSPITATIDPDDFHAVIIASAGHATSDCDALAEVIEAIPGRSTAVLVDLEGEPRPSGTQLELSGEGRLRAPSLGIDVRAAQLSADEAHACALLLDLTLDEQVVPVVPPDGDTAVFNLAGALPKRLTEPRPEVGATGDESLLPLDAVVYADAAATTVEDVELLAPRAAPEACTTVEAADPALDEDLARWESPTLSAAKLTLLGPVGARTTGDTKATAHRRPFYVELLAYLVLHPRGASGHEVADAFGIRPERVRVDMSQLRRWLGNDARTGTPYLPKAQPGPDPESPALYKLDGVLCDLDLFRRLRARGQSRGARGIDDLIAALRLVSGEPFTDLRNDHWSWLLDGDRWDHIMTSAIVDVGHVVTTHALAAGDHDLALWAARVAYTAAPYDEVAQLDMVQAEKSAGDHTNADQVLDERIFNRRDDELPPIGLPKRTAQIVDSKGWATRGPRPRRTG